MSGEASATSTARTAYPSMAELSNLGRSTVEVMSSQRLRPRASSRCWLKGGSSLTQLSRYSRCASIVRKTGRDRDQAGRAAAAAQGSDGRDRVSSG